jgi:hypothetical protein
MWFLWLIVACVLGWIVLSWCFIVVVTCYLLIESGVRIPWVFRFPGYVAFYIGLPLDYAWDLIVGSVAFRERWRGEKFTSRCKRHKAKGSLDWRGRRAIWWCDAMEIFHKGHCD